MNIQQIPAATITPFAIKDYDNVFSLWQNCDGVGLSSADTKQSIAAYLARNPGLSFVAWERDTLVGTILCGHDGRRGYIHHLAVRDDHRRHGIGRQLVINSLNALKKEGIQKCHLFIFHENESGIAFWQRNGWVFRQDIRVMSVHINKGNY